MATVIQFRKSCPPQHRPIDRKLDVIHHAREYLTIVCELDFDDMVALFQTDRRAFSRRCAELLRKEVEPFQDRPDL
jgi:hypothetical protein